MRIALRLEYDGTHFHGWQIQPQLRTVQGVLEKALAQIAQHSVETCCAGRTDKGVHAREQIIHFDTTTTRDLHAWLMGTNHFLPKDVRVHHAKIVSEEFHARYSALSRTYEYWIENSTTFSAIHRHHRLWYPRALDEFAMQKAAYLFLGEHDFSAFRAAECQAPHAIREIKKIHVTREKNLIKITITANAFLHHMVRNIVGVLLPIGTGEKPIDWAQEVLQSQDRKQAGVTASPQGLFLVYVEYPSKFN